MSTPRFPANPFTDMVPRRGATSSKAGLDTYRRLAAVEQTIGANAIVDTDELNIYRALGSSLLTYNFDPCHCTNATDNSAVLSTGLAYFQAVYLPSPATVTGVATYVQTAGVGTWTVGRSAVYSAAGDRIAQTGNASDAWKSVGLYQQALTSGTLDLDRGLYYVALLNVRSATTTQPSLASRNSFATSLANVLTQSAFPRATTITASDLAASYTLSSGTLSSAQRWVALY